MKQIEFQFLTEKNYGTPENPNIVSIISKASYPYTPENVERAKSESYNGEYQIVNVQDPRPLNEIKSERIAQSKSDLAAYLEAHPLQWTDGQFYSITAEKQAQLTSTIICAQADGQPPEWNSTGGVCRGWDVQELVSLGVYIKNRVKALVSYQQTQEVAMRNAATQEDLDAVVVDYDSVPMPEATT